MEKDYNIVLMATNDTVENVFKYYEYFDRNLLVNKIVVIGPRSIEGIVKDKDTNIIFLDEDSVVDDLSYSSVTNIIGEINKEAVERTGWYLQQFLKMAYAYVCEEDYYLVWDSDTIPLHKIEMFDSNGKVFLDVKSEYHKPYYDTMENLGLKISNVPCFSFISEHMLIDKKKMIELIETIEKKASIQAPFWQIVLKSINASGLKASGFSEFETYGNYVYLNYTNDVSIRKWKSLRSASLFYETINADLVKRLSAYFDAVSFENRKRKFIYSHKLFGNIFFVVLYEYTKEIIKKLFRILGICRTIL